MIVWPFQCINEIIMDKKMEYTSVKDSYFECIFWLLDMFSTQGNEMNEIL